MVEVDKPPKDKSVSSGSGENNIDQYDPLYLHSNDTNGVPIIGFKLEGTENYKIWKAAITIAIHTKNKLGFINGKIPRPVEAGFMQEQWDRCNSVVLNWILGCVSQDVFMGQVFSKIAKVVWDELEETYSKQDASVIFNMHYKIYSLTQSRSPLSEYYHKFNALWRQYDSLVNLPDSILKTSGKKIEVSNLNMTVGHPNGTKVVVTHVGSLRLTCQIVIHDVLVVPGYEDSVLRTQEGAVQSREGYKNFLTVVDDFTRAVWVFLLRGKDEDNGILHQTSCSYTPQQNGIAERKHRHLLNVGFPSSVLSGKTPNEDSI
ncbi:putative transcription factor interactor and regulator CCHC(Zn) family protein [Tanacetum coccineum]